MKGSMQHSTQVSRLQSTQDMVREIVVSGAPRHFLEDEESIQYLCSLIASDDGPRDRNDIAELVNLFFGGGVDDPGEASASAFANITCQITQLLREKNGDGHRGHSDAIDQDAVTDPLIKSSRRFLQEAQGNLDHFEEEESRRINKAEARKKRQQEKRAARQQKRSLRKKKIHSVNANSANSSPEEAGPSAATSVEVLSTKDLEDLDDHSGAWEQVKKEGGKWGGRGYGGRGLRSHTNTASNIHLCGVSLLFSGNELLQNATIQITAGHRYGLIGRNGVGKSTLLRRLANKNVPGFPLDVQVMLVKQQVDGGPKSTLEVLLGADKERSSLLAEQSRLEENIELVDEASSNRLDEIVERLSVVACELEAIEADKAEERALDVLKGLRFTREMIDGPTSNLSGGWRMRLALAKALFVPCDLLLLDEPSNHLDLEALIWLQDHLISLASAVIIVSHDRAFLDGVCTDIINFEHKKLKYFVGDFSSYEQQREETAARHAQILDASERQRAKAVSFIEQQKKATSDPKKQRQAKMIKEKKLERIGNYREDGKKYKTRSLKKLSEDYLRTAEKVIIEADEPVIKLKLTDPTWPPGVSPGSALLKMESLSFSYSVGGKGLLQNISLDVNRGSKIAVVGSNGQGKSTLIKIMTGDLCCSSKSLSFNGELWRHPCLRIGHVTQHHVEELDEFAGLTVLQYAEQILLAGSACSDITKSAAGNIRQYLGAFGLGGKHANRPIGTLSGGERMRLCFCTVLAEQPHVLLLDEPSNHCDLETLDGLSAALGKFQGAVVVISHNQGFLSGFCKELWVVQSGGIDVRHGDTQSFDEIFLQYRSEVISSADARISSRENRARMAKKAQKQRAGAVGSSGFVV
eukprot:CAMPEP_0113548804 /NCGR_PEP_ID=MMETSP0015_2-20120614/13087_1 /TAXON_ID=2838 /ORGANISM="Odontella" /LENGTH=864 /DNA_ID=CAMNT_0000449455 /DNA_START=194 /DNA_END=2788 /DNA_ORIENTATION=- /assembly_acc=CAM_ASM_000160